MNINWFPGHMARARREIKESMKSVDAVIEMRDARIVYSSANPEVDEICGNKPRLILLNKSDLCEDAVTSDWIQYLRSSNIEAVAVNSKNGVGIRKIKPALERLLQDKIERRKQKGLKMFVIRAVVVGIPNVGKSSFINKVAKNSIAKTGNKPGVTRSNQWVKTGIGIEIMDTPGILWPKLEEETTSINLALTGAIKDEIMDIEELALKLVEIILNVCPKKLTERYKIDVEDKTPLEVMDEIGKRRGALVSGGNIDYRRVSVMLLDEFRNGKIGRISLEVPKND